MKRLLTVLSLPALITLSSVAAADQGPSLRRGGDAVGSDTLGFSFDNTQSLGFMNFYFDYDDGEYDWLRIGHLVGLQASHNWLSSETPAPYSYDVKHYPAPGAGEVHTVHREECTDVCELGIPVPPSGQVLVLAGFLFESHDGLEHQVHTIAIEPDPESGHIWVELDGDEEFSYDATVQYSYIPENEVNGGDVLSATGVSDPSNPRVELVWNELAGNTSPVLLNGFRIEYVDSVARSLSYLHVRAGGRKANVWFHDEMGNEPFSATVHVVPTTY
ncbi:MAG: hypothetical protein AAF799_16855 [Myxococcota bacterium]